MFIHVGRRISLIRRPFYFCGFPRWCSLEPSDATGATQTANGREALRHSSPSRPSDSTVDFSTMTFLMDQTLASLGRRHASGSPWERSAAWTGGSTLMAHNAPRRRVEAPRSARKGRDRQRRAKGRNALLEPPSGLFRQAVTMAHCDAARTGNESAKHAIDREPPDML